jgi:energy-coupling factor transport system ATP-binding protein
MGKTVIVITHHLYLMPGFAERVLVMRRGRLIFDGPLRDAFHELDILRSSYVSPPQAVLLARELARRSGARLPLLTPEELAGCLTPRAREAVHG